MYNYKLYQVLKRKMTGFDHDVVLLTKEDPRGRTFPHKDGSQSFILLIEPYFNQETLSFHFHKLLLKHNSKIESVRCNISLC